jgi:hypothetical protein
MKRRSRRRRPRPIRLQLSRTRAIENPEATSRADSRSNAPNREIPSPAKCRARSETRPLTNHFNRELAILKIVAEPSYCRQRAAERLIRF